MKKLFIVLAVASIGLVSCGNEGENTVDEATRIADSTRVADSLKKVADDAAAKLADTANKAPIDTTKH